MERWEYKVLNLGGVLKSIKHEDLEATLNGLGQEGWEVVSSSALDSGSRLLVVLKRRVGGSSKAASETWGKW